MHPTALEGFRRMLHGADLTLYDTSLLRMRVLDVGGADVNGTVHALIDPRAQISVMDIEAGPGVTIVADATDPETWADEGAASYDLVISTEVFEHVQGWGRIIGGIAFALRPGGWFVGTCASSGRRPHGARGAVDPAAGEWYANVHPTALADALTVCFEGEVVVEYSRRPDFPTTHDLYWRAQKL